MSHASLSGRLPGAQLSLAARCQNLRVGPATPGHRFQVPVGRLRSRLARRGRQHEIYRGGRLLDDFDRRYHVTSSWRRLTIAVTVTGVGFFDFKHGQSGVAPNAIELHPVLGISFGRVSKPISPPSTGKPPKAPTRFSLRAWVTPNPMPHGAYPTLHAQTVAGASCTASAVYSTGRAPRSFDGSARTAGSSGTVTWTWHEETSGTGETARVTCSYRGTSRTAATSFAVTH